jgi:hypothetical protein
LDLLLLDLLLLDPLLLQALYWMPFDTVLVEWNLCPWKGQTLFLPSRFFQLSLKLQFERLRFS